MQEIRSVATNPNRASKGPLDTPETDHKPKLMDRLRESLCSRHYSRRTEQTYCHWIKRYIFWNQVMTLGLFKNCWDTRMLKLLWFTRMCWITVQKECEVPLMNQKRCLILISIRHLLFMTILRNIKGVNEIMRFLYPEYRRNRLTAQRAGGSYNDQPNYCYTVNK